jgi:hemolysin III
MVNAVFEAKALSRHCDKPRFRGVSHQFAFFGFLLATALLLTIVQSSAGRTAVLVYGASACFLFGTSALYHRRSWSEKAAQRMRRIDHSAIFVLIAGSYSPVFMLLPPEDYAGYPMTMIWLLASIGVLKAIFWPESPGWITAALAIGVGWMGVIHVSALSPLMGTTAVALIVTAGAIYTVGGIVYALRRPDPIPTVFGYHEVFHAIVITGGITHFVHVVFVLRAAGAFGA